MTVSIIDPQKDRRWDEFIFNHENSSIYHHSLWKEIIQKSYGYQPNYFILEKDDKIIAGIPFFLIKSYITGTRLVSLPFSDYCDVLTNNKEHFDIIQREVLKLSKKIGATFVEFRVKKNSQIFNDFEFTETGRYKNHVLVLNKPLEVIRQGFHRSCIRQSIQKALKSDLVHISGENEADLKIFYELYVLTRKRKGLPPQPYTFFRNIWYFLYGKNMFNIQLVYDNSKPIAGLILTKYKDTMYALYNGSILEYQIKRPNHLLFWKAIEKAYQEKLYYFDFGRTATDNHSLLDFKRRWGTHEYDIITFRNKISKQYPILINQKNFRNNIVRKFIKSIPVSVLKFGGKIMYKHLG